MAATLFFKMPLIRSPNTDASREVLPIKVAWGLYRTLEED
jgi:hypothetical protein